MIRRFIIASAAASIVASIAAAEAPVEVVVAYDRGVQITAPQEWLQLITGLGIDQVRFRGIQQGDQPELESLGTDDRPRYRVTGVLDARDVLTLPGGRFKRSDAGKLGDYLKNLAGDGAEGVLAPKGKFGLTETQFKAVWADLSGPVGFGTIDVRLHDVLKNFDEALETTIVVDATASEALSAATVADDLSAMTRGTGLALALRSASLVMIPTKARGEEVVLHVVPSAGEKAESWPIGWPVERNQRQAAPKLFDFLTIEVEDYTLKQAVDAIGPRLGMPLFWDHAMLTAKATDPRETKVKLAKVKSYHKRILDRLLFQARLKGEIRADEAETVFYWIGD